MLNTWAFEESSEAVIILWLQPVALQAFIGFIAKDTPVLIYHLHNPSQPVSFHHTSPAEHLSLFARKAHFMTNSDCKLTTVGQAAGDAVKNWNLRKIEKELY